MSILKAQCEKISGRNRNCCRKFLQVGLFIWKGQHPYQLLGFSVCLVFFFHIHWLLDVILKVAMIVETSFGISPCPSCLKVDKCYSLDKTLIQLIILEVLLSLICWKAFSSLYTTGPRWTKLGPKFIVYKPKKDHLLSWHFKMLFPLTTLTS